MNKKQVMEKLNMMDDEELVNVWNEYVDAINDFERRIYFMYELNDICYGMSATDLLNNLDTFDTCDDYFIDGIYGLKSISDIYDELDNDELADYIIDNIDDFNDFNE